MRCMPNNSNIVFTHNNLIPTNIIVHNGQINGITDWRCAGYYPPYWELFKMMWTSSIGTEWALGLFFIDEENYSPAVHLATHHTWFI